MPLHQEIEGGQGEGQACLESRPPARQDLFPMTNTSQHRQHRLHQHTRVPGAPRTELEIGGIALFGMEGGVAQDNHVLLKGFNPGVEGGVRRIGPRAVPSHDPAQVIEQQAELLPPTIQR